jgi:nicotinate-nucleotide adenylyltransferase
LKLVVHHAPRARAMAILGGSFDPVHVGHLAIARAAQRRFHLDEIHFVVSGRHPFRQKRQQTPFPQRYAMVALACAEHAHYVPSLAEAGAEFTGITTQYSVDTVRRFRQQLHARDALYFIIGADSFVQIPMWKDYETLLDSCDFIVASRPGYRLDPLRLVIPPELLRRPAASRSANGGSRQHHDPQSIALRRTTVHLLDAVRSHISSTEVRRRRANGETIHGLVPPRVEDYILQQALYTK